jgi:hypothetical protein
VQISTLLVGGGETLPKIIAGGLLQLDSYQDQRDALVEDSSLVPQAFEEIVRLEGVLQFVGRTLVRDATIGGQPMRAGQRVLLLLQSANRDENEFAEPEVFSIHRTISRQVGFGHGVHFCIGAHAARLVGIALLRGLLHRFPDYRPDRSAATRPPSEFQIGWTSLPIDVRVCRRSASQVLKSPSRGPKEIWGGAPTWQGVPAMRPTTALRILLATGAAVGATALCSRAFAQGSSDRNDALRALVPEGQPGDLDVTQGDAIYQKIAAEVGKSTAVADFGDGSKLTGPCGGFAWSYNGDGKLIDAAADVGDDQPPIDLLNNWRRRQRRRQESQRRLGRSR